MYVQRFIHAIMTDNSQIKLGGHRFGGNESQTLFFLF